MTGAIFLDRDGTINVRAAPHEYVTSIAEFEFLPGALDALAFLAQNFGGQIVIVTNQACVGRGLVRQAQVDGLHVWMQARIREAGGRIDGVYVCPHRPEEHCPCRKPEPGLFLQAARDHEIDLAQSAVIGDSGNDLRAGWLAGVPHGYLLVEGRTLLDAVRTIIGGEHGRARL